MLYPRRLIPALLALLVACGMVAWILMPSPQPAPAIAVEDEDAEVPDVPVELPAAPAFSVEQTEDAEPEPEPAAEEAPAVELDEAARRRANLARLRERLAELRESGAVGSPRIVRLEDGTFDIKHDGPPNPSRPTFAPRPRLGSDPVGITLSGRVTDEAGRAIENVRIHVWPSVVTKGSDGKNERTVLGITKPAKDVMPPHDVERPGTSNYHLMAAGTVVAVTDANGYFNAEIEAARLVDSHAIEDMHVSIRPTKPGYAWRSNAEFNNVKPGARLEDIRLVMSRAAVLAGRVVDEDGKPIAKALVGISRPNDAEPDDGPLPGRAIYHDMRTTETGEFRFDALQPGTWRVWAYTSERTSATGTQTIKLTPGQVATLPDFQLMPATTLRIRVLFDEELSDKSSERPKVTFHLRHAGGRISTRAFTVNAEGVVTYRQLPLDTMQVSISAVGYLESAPFPIKLTGEPEIDLGEERLIRAPN